MLLLVFEVHLCVVFLTPILPWSLLSLLGRRRPLPDDRVDDRFSEEAGYSDALVARADYISGRDEKSVVALSELLETLEKPRVKPNKVRTVRDAVLSDNYYTDVKDNCWNRGPGEKHVGVGGAGAGR